MKEALEWFAGAFIIIYMRIVSSHVSCSLSRITMWITKMDAAFCCQQQAYNKIQQFHVLINTTRLSEKQKKRPWNNDKNNIILNRDIFIRALFLRTVETSPRLIHDGGIFITEIEACSQQFLVLCCCVPVYMQFTQSYSDVDLEESNTFSNREFNLPTMLRGSWSSPADIMALSNNCNKQR